MGAYFHQECPCKYFHLSFLQLCEAYQYCMLKNSTTSWCSPPPNAAVIVVFSSDVLSTFKSVPQLPKSSTLLRLKRNSSDQNIFSFIFQGCQDVVLQTLSMLQRGFSLHGRRAQALAVDCVETAVPADLSTCGPWLLYNYSDNSFSCSACKLAGNTWLWPDLW